METVSGTIFDIKKYSIHDGPGIRTSVFFKGCPLHCWWCHNPESQSPKPELMLRDRRCVHCGMCQEVCSHAAVSAQSPDGAAPGIDRQVCQGCGECAEICFSGARELVGKRVTVVEVMTAIERDRPFYDQSGGGVTLSGGEPMKQPAFMLALLQACQEADIHTALDTSGYAPWKLFEQTLPLVDLFLYDLKVIDEKLHRQVTGVSNRLILNNLRRLSEAGAHLLVRIPLIPGVNNGRESLHQFGKLLFSLPNLLGVEIMPYHDIAKSKYAALGRSYLLSDLKHPAPENVRQAVELLQSYGLHTSSLTFSQKSLPEVTYDDAQPCANLAPTIPAGD
jgi:pyruvate formate lyase activating enzyme